MTATRRTAPKPIASPRPTSVSGARPRSRGLGIEIVDDTWLEVDDVHIEALAADERSASETIPPIDFATLTERHAAELAAAKLDYETRLSTVERERDAALERVAELEALFARQTAAPPPPLPSPSVERTPTGNGPIPTPVVPTPPALPPTMAARSERSGHVVPTLSDVLVATDIHDGAGAERRSTPRLARQFELEFNYETHFYAGLSLDISSGGLFIATYHLLPVGTLLWLSFSLPDETRLSVQGEVRWVRSSDEEHERPGMGVAFKELSAEALSKISAYCAERPPLYIDL